MGLNKANSGSFTKGHIPWSKGKKIGSLYKRSTSFKPGNLPHSWRPTGTTRLRGKYLQVKVSDTGVEADDWRYIHKMIWEKSNGKIPEGHIVVFRDGDPSNITLKNLELITRAENMRRNSVHNLPLPLVRVIQLNTNLKRMINEKSTGTNRKNSKRRLGSKHRGVKGTFV